MNFLLMKAIILRDPKKFKKSILPQRLMILPQKLHQLPNIEMLDFLTRISIKFEVGHHLRKKDKNKPTKCLII